MNTTQSWRVSNQIHKFIFSLSHFVVSPNDLCLSFLTWNLEISDFQYHPQIRLLTKSLKHINKTELFFFFRKMPIILEKIKCDVMYLGSVFFFFLDLHPKTSIIWCMAFYHFSWLLERTFFWTQTTAFLLFWLLTYLISMHKILFLFIREQQEASCGIPTQVPYAG